SLVCGLLSRGSPGKADPSPVIGVDVDFHEAGQLLLGELLLDLDGNHRVLRIGLGRRAVGIRIGRVARNRQQQRAGYETAGNKFGVHNVSFLVETSRLGATSKPSRAGIFHSTGSALRTLAHIPQNIVALVLDMTVSRFLLAFLAAALVGGCASLPP